MSALAPDSVAQWLDVHASDMEPYDDVMRSAAAIVQAYVESEPIQWCDEHKASVPDESPDWCHESVFLDWIRTERNGPEPTPCRISTRQLGSQF